MKTKTSLRGTFRCHSLLFRRYSLDIMSRSNEYSNIEHDLDAVLLLADRVLIAFEEDLDFNQVQRISQSLQRINAAIDRNYEEETRAVEALLQSTEQWCKAILWLVNRPVWNNLNRNKKQFTLFPCVRELDLLTQIELDTPPESNSSIQDEVRRLLAWVVKDRNFVTHETYGAPAYTRERFLTSALIALIAPIYKHYDTIRQELRTLVTSPAIFEDEEVESLIRLVDGERKRHWERFRAREEWIDKLKKQLLESPNESMPYFLLIGHEGLGKSAICAALATGFTSTHIDYSGANAGNVRKIAPWLPHVILHFGKESNHPYEIVKSLLAQANCLLLEPIEMPEHGDSLTTSLEPKSIQSIERSAPTMYLQGNLPQKFGRDVDAYIHTDHHTHYPTLTETTYKTGKPSLDFEHYRRTLYLVFEKVVREYGPITIILDALDEISADGSSLQFLPENLPPGVSALLTARKNSNAVLWTTQNRTTKKITLTGLKREEIPLLTGVSDNNEESQFNERVWKASEGWPLIIQHIAQLVPEYRDDLKELKISQGTNGVFERQVKAWEQAYYVTDSSILLNVLHLLAVFEPVMPLDLDSVQSFVEYQGVKLSSSGLRKMLQPVNTQLEGLETGQIKLGFKAFAEYVREIYCSKKDFTRAIEMVVNWLSNVDDTPAKVISSFLQHWSEPSTVKDDRFIKSANQLVDALIERGNAKLMYNVSLHARSKDKKNKKMPDKHLLPRFSVQLLEAAAELEHVPAMRQLGIALLNGDGVNENTSKGHQWLQRAIALNDAKAKMYLGELLLNGEKLTANHTEGERLLREAGREGNTDAKGVLAVRLLDGKGVTQNIEEGEELLRELIDEKDTQATFILAIRLLQGESVTKNIDEGRDLLRELWNSGNSAAGRVLASHLLNSDNLAVDIPLGMEILRNMSASGDAEAMISLSNYFLDSTNPSTEQINEGEALLVKAIEQKSNRAARIYANRLLNGNGLPTDLDKGKKLLLEAAQSDDLQAMTSLAIHLIDSGSSRDGEEWLYKAAHADYGVAMAILGSRLVTGDGISKNPRKGQQWLRKAADAGEPQAMRILGHRLLNGDGLVKNSKEGEDWLRKAAAAGEPRAMGILGSQMLDGNGLAKNSQEGEDWLRKAADAGEPRAMGILGSRLLDGNSLAKNSTEGEEWLRKAATAGEPQAMYLFGSRLLDGDCLTKNSTEGEEWLRKAATAGEPLAMYTLGYKLLDGNGLAKSSTEGEEWLRKAAAAGKPQAMAILCEELVNGNRLQQNLEEAQEWLYHLIEASGEDRNNALVYVLRRLKASLPVNTPTVAEILKEEIQNKDPVPLINYALVLASGYKCNKDWIAADQIIASIDKNEAAAKEILDWWYHELVFRNDPEGHLVVGWVVRHGIATDPDNIALAERMQLARDGGWDVPSWMDTAVV